MFARSSVPVAGGALRIAVSGSGDGTVVVGLHGITANHVSWTSVAHALGGDVRFVAPDLRGRGDSAALTGPYGMSAHAADVIAILDHLGADRAVLAGHSMGGFVSVVAAAEHAARIASVVLVDGGLPLPEPPPGDIDAVLESVIGPAMKRLSMTFESRRAYHDFWREHPALKGAWSPLIEAYLDYDLRGTAPSLRASASLDAVRTDAADTVVGGTIVSAARQVKCPVRLLWCPRGLMDETPGLYRAETIDSARALIPQLSDELVPDTNHYTITLSERGAEVVAGHIREAVASSSTSGGVR